MREALAAGKLSLGVGVRGLRTGEIARMMKTAGFDWLFIDLEHGPSSVETAFTISVAALDAGIVPIVRVPEGETVLGGTLSRWRRARRVRFTRRDGRGCASRRKCAAVSAARIVARPAVATRSSAFAAVPPRTRYRPSISATMIMATLETSKAVENASAIAAVPGIDVLTMGLNDLSVDMGIPGQLGHDKIAAAVASVAHAARAAGKFAGFGGVYQPDLIKKYVGFGMRMILCGNDVGLLMAAAQERADFVRNCAP